MAKKIVNVVYKVDDKELHKAKTAVQGIEKETKDSEKEMLKLNDAAKKVGTQGGQSILSFKNLLASISVAAVVAAFTQLGRKILELGIKQEQLNIAFNTFLGSAEKGKAVLKELTKFSIVTPFTPDQVNSAAKALLAFGVQGNELIPVLKMLGDVSSGTGKDLTEMAIIFGQIRSTGRLMGQDLLQLINAGFNPLQVISQKTGRSMRALKDDMEKGAISFQMVSDAFKTATSEGGLFFNLMEKQSATVGGKLSTIEGNIEEIGKKLFENNSGPVADLVGLTADLTSNVEGLANAINFAISLTKNLNLLYHVFSLINREAKEAAESNRAFMLFMLNQAKAIDGTTQSLEERRKTIQQIVYLEEQLGFFKPATTEDPLPWVKPTKTTEIQKTAEQIAKLKEAMKPVDEKDMFINLFPEGYDPLFDDALKRLEDFGQDWDKEREDQYDREFQELVEKGERELEEIEAQEANKQAAMRQSHELAIQLGAELLANSLMQREIDTQGIRDKYDRELELAGDNDRAKEQIEKERDKKLADAEARNKEIQKRNARSKILIDTAVAVIKTFSQFGYPAGIIPAALMTALGGVALANVRKFKKGEVNIDGKGTGTSDSIPAMISKGESVINAGATAKSQNLLEAINDRKIDDRILYSIAANGGRQANFDTKPIVDAINKNKVDYDNHGYTIYKGIQQGSNFKRIIRSKVQGY